MNYRIDPFDKDNISIVDVENGGSIVKIPKDQITTLVNDLMEVLYDNYE